MAQKRILAVFGTRPEAIKMAPVIAEIRRRASQIQVKVCITAQHRDMLDDVLRTFRIRPNYDLNIMEEGQSLEHIAKSVMERFPSILKKEKPDLVLVHGDTSTTLLATLASFYGRVPVGHVEAGLRSYDFSHPFPEEANRRLADSLCSLHFAPTGSAKENLLKENISSQGIYVTGNTVIDALQWAVREPHTFQNPALRKYFSFWQPNPNKHLILVTAHRRENFGEPIRNICSALKTIADRYPQTTLFYPVHPNPNVQTVARRYLSNHARIFLLPPLNYLDFSLLIKNSTFVVTDSGGLQEEAPSLGKPVLVLRKVTERPEAVRAGAVRVIGTEKKDILREMAALLEDRRHYEKMAMATNPYGDGHASERIVSAILHNFKLKKNKPVDFVSVHD
ncbi:MAG: UDP-N-acetylglucosamine 2-epimerase (non-hydrolyzing) [Elusimicrobia bacterium]|nr:UDP-N-acetylglucosamine 2-epimerase (non-hydrolyzing) [Elusimicrobiota bacterium]